MKSKASEPENGVESVDQKRARFERFSMTVCGGEGGGYVNVQNDSYGDDSGAHIYSVEVENGEAVGCSCPHATRRGAHCKHQVAVENRPLVISSATAAANTSPTRVATDGGNQQSETDHWGQPVERFDNPACGGGEKCQCQSCGERFEVAMVAATADSSNRNWEEFYRCESCGAKGSFRFIGELDRRMWTGQMDYPTATCSEQPDMGGGASTGPELL